MKNKWVKYTKSEVCNANREYMCANKVYKNNIYFFLITKKDKDKETVSKICVGIEGGGKGVYTTEKTNSEIH